MNESKDTVHPYIPNTAPRSRAEMLQSVRASNSGDLYDSIPDELKLNRPLNLPEPLVSELDLKRHMQELLAKNVTCEEQLNFKGAGCWQHYVPAVCDEIAGRAEFLTAYGGDTYADLGKYQAIFEFQSMVGELVGMDVVSAPTYDWVTAATSAMMMATRITKRGTLLIAGTVNPQLLTHAHNFVSPWATIETVPFHGATGMLDLDELRQRITNDVAAVYFENPSFLGFIETQAHEISALAHDHGALSIVGVDPSSLGVLAAPSDYGADIVCGDVQPLGNHMHFGGGLCGFIASRDEPAYVMEYPTFLVSTAPGVHENELGFGWALMSRTSFDAREASPDFTGSSQWLWGIVAASYLALMGPQGMYELGKSQLQRTKYATNQLRDIAGVSLAFSGVHYKEFLVNFDASGKSVQEINLALDKRGIFGGHDVSNAFPALGQSALYCVTEVHSKQDIDRLVTELKEVLA